MKHAILTERKLMAGLLLGAGFLCSGIPAAGQDLSAYVNQPSDTVSRSPQRAFAGMLVANGNSTTLAGNKELILNISHRFGYVNSGFYELFGLDNATMRLGFDYGFLPWLSAGFGRSTWEKDWDIHLKTGILRQSRPGSPLNLVMSGQLACNSLREVFPAGRDGFTDRLSYSVQALASHDFGRFSVQLAPVYLHTAYETELMKTADLVSLGMAADVKLTRMMSLTLEYYAGLLKPDPGIRDPLSVGLDIVTGGHTFQLVFGNSRGMFDKAMLLNTTDTWRDGGIYFGFNLIRVFYPSHKD